MSQAFECDICGEYFKEKCNPALRYVCTDHKGRKIHVIVLVVLDDLSEVENYEGLNYNDYHPADICPHCMLTRV